MGLGQLVVAVSLGKSHWYGVLPVIRVTYCTSANCGRQNIPVISRIGYPSQSQSEEVCAMALSALLDTYVFIPPPWPLYHGNLQNAPKHRAPFLGG